MCLSADAFTQHLDVELSEEDVQTVTSDSKAKTQITVTAVALGDSAPLLGGWIHRWLFFQM